MADQIVPFGWCVKTPNEPSKTCRWCNKENVLSHGVIVCPVCDLVPSWPSNQPTETP